MEQDINDMEQIVKDAIDQKEMEICTEIIVIGGVGIALYILLGAFATFMAFAITLVVLLSIRLALRIHYKVRERREVKA